MTTTQIAARKGLYRIICSLPDEKAARVMGYIKALEVEENEPPLTADEEEGLRIANAELAQGEGRSFKETFKELW